MPNSKAFLYILSASAINPLEKFLIFPPHNIIFSDLPEKNTLAARGTLYFAAFILPKTIIQSTLAPLSFKPSNKRRSTTSFVSSSSLIFDTHIRYLCSISFKNPFMASLINRKLNVPAQILISRLVCCFESIAYFPAVINPRFRPLHSTQNRLHYCCGCWCVLRWLRPLPKNRMECLHNTTVPKSFALIAQKMHLTKRFM